MRNLGLDLGDKRTGVAISDPQGVFAIPMTVIADKDEDATINDIVRLIEQNKVECVVLGLPYSLDGTLGRQANKVKIFADKLSQAINLDIQLWDERFSTTAANRLMIEAGTKRKKKKQHRDAVAAAIILQGYLDSLRD